MTDILDRLVRATFHRELLHLVVLAAERWGDAWKQPDRIEKNDTSLSVTWNCGSRRLTLIATEFYIVYVHSKLEMLEAEEIGLLSPDDSLDAHWQWLLSAQDHQLRVA